MCNIEQEFSYKSTVTIFCFLDGTSIHKEHCKNVEFQSLLSFILGYPLNVSRISVSHELLVAKINELYWKLRDIRRRGCSEIDRMYNERQWK